MRRLTSESTIAAAAILVWGLLLVAGGGPFLPALTAFALGAFVVLAIVAARRAVALRRARAASERSQEHFVSEAAHQLRTPLAALRLRLDELGEHANGGPLAEAVGAADAEAERLEALTESLLGMTPGSGPGVEVSAAQLARDVVARVRPLAEKLGAELQLTVLDDPVVRATGLERALTALVENAIHYGGGAVEVVVSATGIAVCDSGPGLLADTEALFGRFARGPAGLDAHPAGTGLGLSIARTLARAGGGDVTLRSRRDAPGTEATLTFVRVEASS